MSVDQENVSKILSVLSHRLRREILLILSEKGEASFTDLLNALNVDTGKLSFHIRNLAAFVEQTQTGKYKLSLIGEHAVRVIHDVEYWAETSTLVSKPSLLNLASFRQRAYAFLIDLALTMGIAGVFELLQIAPYFGESMLGLSPGLMLFFALGLLWIYSTLLEGFNGQTIGKRVFHLKAVRTDGKKLKYDHAAVRNFGKAFLLPFDLLMGLKIKNKEFVRYFDKFADTTVVDLKPQPLTQQQPQEQIAEKTIAEDAEAVKSEASM